ncbi:MAG TPA: class I SAM-dependent methyltransferase [Alphaproteobacteria bacterium]|nr:class I SAM-dependent methyltransferase [Alphaproteobacteria bacterium]
MTPARGVWRRWLLGAATLLGGRRGYFIPQRYAGIPSAPGYPAFEAMFAGAVSEFRDLLAAMGRYADILAGLRGPAPAPRIDQDWFPRLDAAMAYAFVRERRPAAIIEIGSGHSTRFMARAIRDGGLPTRLVAIDPAPRAPIAGLNLEWLQAPLQAVDLDRFGALAAGDVLFVDSSHVLMPGSDVDTILNRILPRLAAGVIVHFHDVFLPDAYPDEWAWRGYNEQNAVAVLLGAGRWRPLWSSRWVATRMRDAVTASALARLPLASGAFESSLWIERL